MINQGSCLTGGNWSNAADAGLWYVNCNNDPSNSNTNIGARLADDTWPEAGTLKGGQSVLVLRGDSPCWQQQKINSAPRQVPIGNVAAPYLMPKTHNHLYPKIIAFDNLLAAYRDCRKGKRYTHQALEFAQRMEENLFNIHNHLVWKTWQPGTPRRFVVLEPKRREITAPPFADRIVHHAVMRICGPLFERRFAADSFACREGKGAQAAVSRLQQFLREASANGGNPYVVKADIRKCFASIRHGQAMRVIARVISCRDTLALFRRIFSGYGNEGGIGIPVGALTSQWACNLLLDQVDHAMQDRDGVRRYVRYMDDSVMVLPDKKSAWMALGRLQGEVEGIGLTLNPKTSVFPATRGVDFAGYRTWATHVLPRKRIIRRARRKFRRLAERYRDDKVDMEYVRVRINSFLAYCRHCSTHRTVAGLLQDTVLQRPSHEN